MRVTVQPELQDYVHFGMMLLMREKQVRFSRALQRFLLPGIALLLTLLERPIHGVHVGVALAFAAVFAYVQPKLFDASIRRKVERMYQSRAAHDPAFLMPYTVETIDGGLRAQRGGEVYTLVYEGMDFYHADDEALCAIGGGFDFILPKRAFPSQEAYCNARDAIDFAIQVAIRK